MPGCCLGVGGALCFVLTKSAPHCGASQKCPERTGRGDTYVQIEHLGPQHIVVDNLDVEADLVLGNVLEKLGQLRPAHTIRTVHDKRAVDSPALDRAHKRLSELLVVPHLADLAKRQRGPLAVGGAHQIVQLRGSEDLVVDILGSGSLEGVDEGGNQLVAGGPGVAAVDDLRGGLEVDLQLGGQLVVDGDELLVARGVHQGGGIALPVLLKHVAHGVDNLDAVVRGRVVARGDHDANGLPVKLAAAEGREQTDAERDALEQVGLHAEASRAIVVELALLEGHDGMPGRGGEDRLVVVLHCCEGGLTAVSTSC